MSGRNFARSAWKKYGFKEMDGHPAPFRMFGNRIKAVLTPGSRETQAGPRPVGISNKEV